MKIALVLAGAVGLLLCVSEARGQRSIGELIRSYIKPGDQFPELVLPDLETGAPRSITEFRGRKLLIHVFASW